MTRGTTRAERDAHARRRAKVRRLQGYGLWEPFAPAEPVRQHLLRLREAGMSSRAVAARLDLPMSAFDYMLYGEGGSAPSEKVRRETAELVLGYWPTLADFPDTGRIDPTGTRRRVHALEALGFTSWAMADRIGRGRKTFPHSMAADRVTAEFARAVSAMYDAWWNQRPEEHGVLPWVADRSRRRAASLGRLGPLAWDDDTIDDPRTVPQLDADSPGDEELVDHAAVQRFVSGRPVEVLEAEYLEAVRVCVARGMTLSAIDALRGLERGSTEKVLNRLRKRCLRAGVELPPALRTNQSKSLEQEREAA